MSIFESISSFVNDLLGRNKKLGSLTADQVQELMSIYLGYLSDFKEFFENTPPEVLVRIRKKYESLPKRNDKYPVQKIILDLNRDTKGKANGYERAFLFGSVKKTIDIYYNTIKDIEKNYKNITKDSYIILESVKLSDIMFFGLVYEIMVVINYFGYLLDYLLIALDNRRQPAGYRQKYLIEKHDVFIDIVNNACNFGERYNFSQSVNRLQKAGADLVVQTNGNSFLPFLDRKKYTEQDEKKLTTGLWGFNIIGGIASLFDMWKHYTIQKAKRHKEWLEHEQARLLQIYQDMDPNSPEAVERQKYIDAYSQEIANLDEKINKYEEGE